MSAIRSILIFIAVVLFAVALYLIIRRLMPTTGPPPALNFSQLTPSSWTLLSGTKYFAQCDMDGNPGNGAESLVLYRYDTTAQNSGGFIGGVVYSAEVNRVPQTPGVQSPYRPAFVVPYKLLPDIYSDKGQGYLGDNDVTFLFFPGGGRNQACEALETTVYGFGPDPSNPTRLSIFRWDPANRRFADTHFAADTRVQVPNGAANSLVTDVSTFDRFSDRSGLCKVHHYTRPGSAAAPPPSLTFNEVIADFTIDFCYGAPADPAYPEGVVMAILRGATPPAGSPPALGSFFLPQANVPSELDFLKRVPHIAVRTLTVQNPGVLGNIPAQGTATPAPNTAPPQASWWLGAEVADVMTTIVAQNQQVNYLWHLRNIANEQVPTDTHWRVESVQRVPGP